ncbi:hypothetical protein ES703_78598 [subsurface metagenome]
MAVPEINQFNVSIKCAKGHSFNFDLTTGVQACPTCGEKFIAQEVFDALRRLVRVIRTARLPYDQYHL